jgi:CBS domain-containing protein
MRRRVYPDMVSDQDLVCLPLKGTARAAARLMTQKRISSVLVTDGRRLLGIVTVRDITRKIVGEARSADRTQLSAIMTPSPVCADADDTPMTALRKMKEGGFRHLPVLQDGKLVGLLVRSDFNCEEEQCLEFEEQLWQHMR